MEYADDISKAISNPSSMENLKHNRAEILKSRDLNVNYGKAEQYIINRTNNEWTLCKYLGSILDTGEDIRLRKILAIAAANQLKIIYNDKKITPETKIKAVKTINTFQRRLLRTYVLNAKWPNIVKNERIQKNRSHRMEQHYSKTKVKMVWESNQSRRINTSKEGI